MSDLRTASAIDVPQVIDAKPAFSNFSFIESLFGNLDSIRRIFSQVRFLGYKTLIVEHIDSVGFSKEDDLDLQSEGISIVLDPLVRVSFFRNEFKNIADITSQDNSSFLGYAILKKIPPDGHWIVFESVIISPRHDNNYLHKLRKYNVNVGGKLFNVKGILYCQQNSLTNVCAHAALRTCISINTPPADFSYSLMNKILR
ncbi:MAG: hypothetical protein WCX91_03835, partial [Candidatus Omnitrophota bacterium]